MRDEEFQQKTLRLLSQILLILEVTLKKEEKIMATIQDVLNDVTTESTLIGGVSTLISNLQSQLATALSGAVIPPAVQIQIDAVFAQAESNKAALSAALVANTPSAPGAPNPPTNTAPATSL